MKRALLLVTLLVSAAGYVFLQTPPPATKLATVMPSGALLYLESPDFGRLVREWDASKVKSDWLQSANHAVFSRSNLLQKLEGVYGSYGDAAGFLPDLKSVIEIAGTDSALALYAIRDVEFLYLSRIGDAELMKSQLWALRGKFEQRQAGGFPFYLRTDPASKRTVAFAFAKGYLLLATRDDLLAQSLELLAGGSNPSIASEAWYHDAAAAARNHGELRLVMDLESLVQSVYFRSYWIQRNASAVRRYRAGIVDLHRDGANFSESRVFLRAPDAAESAPAAGSVANLVALVPPEAGLYRAWRFIEPTGMAALVVRKLIAPSPHNSRARDEAPEDVPLDARAGGEGDLETRIDEQPLPVDSGLADASEAIRSLVERSSARGLLLVQSSAPAGGPFFDTPVVIVLEASKPWDAGLVKAALTTAAGKLWTTSQLGAGWGTAAAGRHTVERLAGLGALTFAAHGQLLFVSNDAGMLSTVLDRTGTRPAPGAFTYAAGFRHLRERAHYERIMTALDFSSPAGNEGFGRGARPEGEPAFFSGDLASLSRVLSNVVEIRVAEQERNTSTVQAVFYQVGE